MFKRTCLFLALALAGACGLCYSSNYLFYLEGLGIAGFSFAPKKVIFYSLHQEEAMQKPSLGFDYVQRFSGETGDFAVLAIQARLAINAGGEKKLEPQLYNAFLKYKAKILDIWVGHNRPALGLASYLDSHGLLLQTVAMNGFGFDRDWGVGKDLLLSKIKESGGVWLDESSLEEKVRVRLALYQKNAGRAGNRAFINIGGS